MRFRVTGAGAMRKTMQRIARQAPNEFARALYQETEIEATEAKRRTPVDTGALRASIHVEGPTVTGRRISTAIVAGGPAAPYAIEVHENLEAFHKVGESKYIERPLMEAAPHLAARIARRIDLNRVR